MEKNTGFWIFNLIEIIIWWFGFWRIIRFNINLFLKGPFLEKVFLNGSFLGKVFLNGPFLAKVFLNGSFLAKVFLNGSFPAKVFHFDFFDNVDCILTVAIRKSLEGWSLYRYCILSICYILFEGVFLELVSIWEFFCVGFPTEFVK